MHNKTKTIIVNAASAAFMGIINWGYLSLSSAFNAESQVIK